MHLISLLFHVLLVNPITNVLVVLSLPFGGNFGIAIIIFTVVMKFVTFPLTSSQYKQTRKMQVIQPKLAELQKKYKGKDPKKLQSETMALYKEHGVNPFGCLLPMLVQMPIWIALYQSIRTTLGETPESLLTLSSRLYPFEILHAAVPLQNQFLWWDLGKPDPFFMLPVLVGITMYVQQKMITPNQQAAGPLSQQQQQQQQTQQMMTWMMPLMFGYITLNVPAGLGLYWLISNAMGIVMQYFYLGRKVDWAGMIRFGPAPAPVPAPAARATNNDVPAVKAKNIPSEDAPGDEGADGVEVDTAGVAPRSPGGDARGKRHGRRRGKR